MKQASLNSVNAADALMGLAAVYLQRAISNLRDFDRSLGHKLTVKEQKRLGKMRNSICSIAVHIENRVTKLK